MIVNAGRGRSSGVVEGWRKPRGKVEKRRRRRRRRRANQNGAEREGREIKREREHQNRE